MRRTVLLSVALCCSCSSYAQTPAPLFELPAPTGPQRIGTTRWVVVDQTRQETFAPGRARQVEVIAWYPADSGGSSALGATAPYLRNGMEEVLSFARLAKLGDAYNGLASVKTHAVMDAAPATGPRRLPVIVFSHGYTGLPSSHTSLMEDLASHGWAVLHVIHPYEATASKLADGTVVTFTGEDNRMHAGIRDVLDEWGAEDATLAAVVAAATDADRETLLRGYLATLKNTHQALQRWVLDVKLVLDRLPNTGAGAALTPRLDLSRLGVAGHSMGGVMAGQFCVDDRRCKAVLNFDGIPQYGSMIDTPMAPALLMVYSGRPGRAGAGDLIYRRSASKYYRVEVRDTLHLDFTDMNYWRGPIAKRAFGALGASPSAEVTRRLAREFFGQEIQGRPSAMLSGRQPLSGVTITEFRRPQE